MCLLPDEDEYVSCSPYLESNCHFTGSRLNIAKESFTTRRCKMLCRRAVNFHCTVPFHGGSAACCCDVAKLLGTSTVLSITLSQNGLYAQMLLAP